MHALGISASPRANGNTEFLVNHCLERLQQGGVSTSFVSLRGLTLKGCIGCGWCREAQQGRCVTMDDDFHPIFKQMKQADIIVVGSPVYFGSATPELMALLDRAGYVSRGNGNIFSRKLGGPLAVARRAGQNFTYAQLLYWYMINDMVVPGSSYWNVAFGKAPGDVEQDSEALATIERFADNLVWLAQKLI